jgi:CubicO group peptidase (beta-lactamase class C family)
MITRCVGAQIVHGQEHLHPPSRFADIDRLVRTEFQKDKRGGLTVGLVENGQLVWSQSYGYTNEQTRRTATNHTIYPIASMTKMVTGIMFLQLVEQGKVHLADTVERYVPEINQIHNPYPWAPSITLIQLATMTSGLVGNQPNEMPTVSGSDPWEKQLLAALPYLKYDCEPGTKSEYSNIGYAILGLALSRAANEPYVGYVESHILEPLGMHDTTFAVTSRIVSRLVTGYFLGDPNSLPARVDNSDRDLLLPAGGLLSTLEDLSKLMRFQLGGGPNEVLAQNTLNDSFRAVVPSDGDLRYGHGVGFAAVRNVDSRLTALGHGGLRRIGFVTSYEFDRSTKSGVILLTNTSYGRANYKVLTRRILAQLYPASGGGTGLSPVEEH